MGGAVSYADVCIWSLLREGSAEDLERVAEAAALGLGLGLGLGVGLGFGLGLGLG